ncbi:MAG: hypothetical protein J7M40_14510 [Planctomycetes bacterium]|nr:hypothetical protein [Planctomycetota bacterium]
MVRAAKILLILMVLVGVQTASAGNNVKLVWFNWISPAVLEPDGTWTFAYMIERDYTYHTTCYYDMDLYLSTDTFLDGSDFYLGTYEQEMAGSAIMISNTPEVIVQDRDLPPNGLYYVIMYVVPGFLTPLDPDMSDNVYTFGFRVTVDSGTSSTYTISGHVRDSTGQGIPGVTLGDLPGAPVTDSQGFYSSTVDYGFTAVVTPAANNLTFVPSLRSYSNVTQNFLADDYTAQLVQCKISGRVLFPSGKPVAGVTVDFDELDGETVSLITDPNGYYGHYVASGWSGSIQPAKDTYTFSPASRGLTDVLLNTEANFVADRAGILYVDPNAPGNNDGSNWPNAFTCLQDAIAEASANNDIYVAHSTYRPDEGSLNTPEDSYATFQLVTGAGLYGGFPNGGGDWSQRDPSTHTTVLSGQLSGGQAFHVVTGADGAVLDGFVVSDGNAGLSATDGRGGGVYIHNVDVTVRNCVFQDNYANEYGGAVYAIADSRGDSISLTLDDCVFENNISRKGGALFASKLATVGIVDCTFSQNSVLNLGGAMFAEYCGTVDLSRSNFFDNEAYEDGGGAVFSSVDNARAANSIFVGNISEQGAGGAISGEDSVVDIANCTIANNASLFSPNGGGVFGSYSTVSALNSILWGNTGNGSSSLRAQIYSAPQNAAVDYSCVRNLDSSVGGTGNIGSDPNFVNTNEADYHLKISSPCINRGSPNADYTGQYDIDGNRRLRYGRADMGADEFVGIDGDLQPDGVVNMADVAIMAKFWNMTCSAPDWCSDCDINQNTNVDLADAVVVAERWLSPLVE